MRRIIDSLKGVSSQSGDNMNKIQDIRARLLMHNHDKELTLLRLHALSLICLLNHPDFHITNDITALQSKVLSLRHTDILITLAFLHPRETKITESDINDKRFLLLFRNFLIKLPRFITTKVMPTEYISYEAFKKDLVDLILFMYMQGHKTFNSLFLEGCTFEGCKFVECSFFETSFNHATLSNVTFQSCHLGGVSFITDKIHNVTIDNSELPYAMQIETLSNITVLNLKTISTTKNRNNIYTTVSLRHRRFDNDAMKSIIDEATNNHIAFQHLNQDTPILMLSSLKIQKWSDIQADRGNGVSEYLRIIGIEASLLCVIAQEVPDLNNCCATIHHSNGKAMIVLFSFDLLVRYLTGLRALEFMPSHDIRVADIEFIAPHEIEKLIVKQLIPQPPKNNKNHGS